MKNSIYRKFFKRAFDIIFSLMFIILSLPFIFVICIIIIVEIREFPLFLQQRIGKDEKKFNIIKLKTMKEKYDKNHNPLPDKLRITKSGIFLRKFSIDELPEFWNVLCGKMSLIGPRPLLPQYLPYYSKEEKLRHTIRPGITGLAQVSGRNYISWDKRLSLDIIYVKKLTFIMDCKILFKTILNVIRSKDNAIIPDEAETYLNEERKYKSLNNK